MASARALAAAGLVSLVLVAGLVVPALAWLGLALDAALLVAFAIDLRGARSTRITAARTLPPLLTQGTAADATVALTVAGPGREIALRDTLHPALAEAPARARFAARPELAWRFALLPTRRGEHRLGPLTARVLGPWGLAWSQRELLPPVPCRVFPRVRWEGRVARLLLLAHRHQLGHVRLRHQGSGGDPYSLRDYLPGDPLSRVHWRATARHGRLLSREDEREHGGRLIVLLDCARSMAATDQGRSKLDHALAAALALARVAVARRDRVTIVPFDDRVGRVVRVDRTSTGLSRAYHALYDLEARLVEPAFDLAVEALRPLEARRSTVVLLTSVVDLAAAELLREALTRAALRHRPLLVNLEDAELSRLARGVPETAPEAFAKVSGLEILLTNGRLVRELRRRGVRAVSAGADALALATLEAYLDITR